MKLEMYTVFDSKAKVYCAPFLMVNEATAIRSFANAANDRNNDVGRYPADHALYFIGLYDDENGKIDSAAPVHVRNANELLYGDE